MDGPLHSILVKGNLLHSGKVSLRLPYASIRNGLWQISLKSIAYKSSTVINICARIESNFVTDVQFSKDGQIETFNPTLILYNLKALANDLKTYQFVETWFIINCPNDILEISFKDSFLENYLLNYNIDVQILILLKRIR